MENFILMGDFESWVTLKETSSQKETDAMVTNISFKVLSNEIVCNLEKYKNACDLWM